MTDRRLVLDGVGRYRVTEAMFEGLRVVLSYRGEPYSPAYVQGISGAAFMVAGPCPCGPTCGHDTDPVALARQFGYEVDELPLWGEGVDPDSSLPQIIARVKDEVRSGRPVLVWNAFTLAEWDVVCGFDDDEGTFIGRGSYVGLHDYARESQDRALTGCDGYPALGAIVVGEKTGIFDAHTAELDALQRAISHARTPEDRLPEDVRLSGDVGAWRFRKGLGCYDWWAGSFRADSDRLANQGDRYCLSIYCSTHRAAATFLREIEPQHPAASRSLLSAATAFSDEADALSECAARLFPNWHLPSQPDPKANQAAARLLEKARLSYEIGIGHLEDALQAAR